MQLEILHTRDGDRKKKFQTELPEERIKASELIEKLMKQGTALILERGKKTYYIKGYDAEKDELVIVIDKKGKSKKVAAKGKKSKVTAIPRASGG